MTIRRVLAVLVAVALALTLAPPPAGARPYPFMTVTFVRHAQTEANAADIVDTVAPGAALTPLGNTQADDVAEGLRSTFPDSIYASPLLRTQQTAGYLSGKSGVTVEVLPGLREIEAGNLEGKPASEGAEYVDVIEAWVHGDRAVRMPGSIDGNEFDARFDQALQHIWDADRSNPVVYSHGGAIQAWTMMNVDGVPDDLAPLPNTGYAVVRGSPDRGWELVDWNGRLFE